MLNRYAQCNMRLHVPQTAAGKMADSRLMQSCASLQFTTVVLHNQMPHQTIKARVLVLAQSATRF